MPNYLADKGGRFASDVHRRVLGHLSPPHEPYGWTVQALIGRMRPDGGTSIESVEEMSQILEELEQDGHARRVNVNGADVWKQTKSGFDVLTGPIADEPEPGAKVVGPAIIGESAATPMPEEDPTPISAEPANQDTPQTEGAQPS